MTSDDLVQLYHNGFFSSLDYHFARFIEDVSGDCDPMVSLSAALVSKVTGEGHTCLDLSALAGKQLGAEDMDSASMMTCPDLQQWQSLLASNSTVGKPADFTPLILDDNGRLYLQRYWAYEQTIADALRKRGREPVAGIDGELLREGIERLFPSSTTEETDWQRVAAVTAVLKKVCIVSGGPGTGKTTTVAKIIALLIEQACGEPLKVALAAPTGKAAARLQEAILRAKQDMNCSETVKDLIPEEAYTVHRLLGVVSFSPYFRHNRTNPLPFEVVIIDESSMVSLALMAKLIDALPAESTLILLGDKDQLGSIEAGSVLGSICAVERTATFSQRHLGSVEDLCGTTIGAAEDEGSGPPFQDCIVELRKNYRFGSASGIGALSRSVRAGAGDIGLSLLKDERFQDIGWEMLPAPPLLARALKNIIVGGYEQYLQTADPAKALALFDRFRILCPVREGPYGIEAINTLVEKVLRREGLIDPERRWYPGRPVMVLYNDYQVKLFNGDVGIILPDPAHNGEFRAFFSTADGGVRSFAPQRLPLHETVYAMTVHKSQGSEFEQVLLLLSDRDLQLLTRELIYTAITRTKQEIQLWGREDLFQRAVSRSVMRMSGLGHRVWCS